MLEDIAVLTNGRAITDDLGIKLESIKIDDLGKAKKVTISKDDTTIADGAGEKADIEARIGQIKRQEPGHFAFYQISATQMIQDGVLAPWQLYVARVLREKGFALVGTNYVPRYQANLGGLMVGLEIDQELLKYAKDIGRLEAKLLWANKNGMEFPPYFLEALRQSIDMYREHGFQPKAP